MGPVRGFKRKRKVKKKVVGEGESTAVASEQGGSADWWDGFSRRITGLYSSGCYSSMFFCCFFALFGYLFPVLDTLLLLLEYELDPYRFYLVLDRNCLMVLVTWL